MTPKKHFISIAGNIGSGKSSLTELMAKRFNWVPYFESVSDNPYLNDFYSDMDRWSFNLQIYFLSHRFRTHKEILALGRSVIQDRSIYEDVEIFARNLFDLGKLHERDFNNYHNLFLEMVSYLKPPDLLVYLKADVDTLVKQIHLRGREFEKNIDPAYLERLNLSYNKWIGNYKHGKHITIETDNLDFVHSEKDLNFIINLVKEELDLKEDEIK